MIFTKIRFGLVAMLCTVVVLSGVALWIIESRLVSAHPECVGTGSPRVAAAELVGERPALSSALDRMLDGVRCSGGGAPMGVVTK
ncbi:hypothetical protein [Tsukamurella ocularis]|uniref:hypothetical protein n=1 Tax=Tsukamurella ocularis TaxID=1970234 RepID=UPI0021699E1A|nr:hypothetical protein [Tsukamurella ocularis]MCS3780697.1 hypothetical protein [Tsukamurella ocularis]MCS3786521.1 hypothetical protein [Tsukamurella ocularis]MCS3850363.1 hypothetical protein [Tsukamurella ocularis]